MVGSYAHSHIYLLILAIFLAGEAADLSDEGCEDVGVIVRTLPLEGHGESLKSHAGVDHLGRKGLEVSICHTVVLHEHKVPDLDHLGIILVDERCAVDLGTLFIAAEVDMDLAAGTAGTHITHLPEVVMTIAIDDMARREVLLPYLGCLLISLETLRGISFKHCGIETRRIKLQHIYQIFPCPIDRLLLEIVAKRPVAKHLKHSVMVGVMSYLFQVVVLARYA